jgi:carboxylate-amine ligase
VLAALSANSPFWNSEDSGYASYRGQAWSRWPTAGVYEIFGSAAAYHDLVETLLASEVPLDEGQIYFDARLSSHHPTVEVRVADVCLQSDDAVLQAALTRALVETAAREWSEGVPPIPLPAAQLRLAAWRASRFGLDGELLDPQLNVLRDGRQVARALFEYVRPVLEEQEEELMVESLLRQTLIRGTGSSRQRAVYARTGSLAEVVSDAVFLTNVGHGSLHQRHTDFGCFHMRGNELHRI